MLLTPTSTPNGPPYYSYSWLQIIFLIPFCRGDETLIESASERRRRHNTVIIIQIRKRHPSSILILPRWEQAVKAEIQYGWILHVIKIKPSTRSWRPVSLSIRPTAHLSIYKKEVTISSNPTSEDGRTEQNRRLAGNGERKGGRTHFDHNTTQLIWM